MLDLLTDQLAVEIIVVARKKNVFVPKNHVPT